MHEWKPIQYIPRNMHTVLDLLCFVVVIHWLIFPYPSGLLHWHCGNLTIVPVPAKQSWWIWINTSCEFIMNDCITTTKQSTTKPCAYFLEYTVCDFVVPANAAQCNKIRRKKALRRFYQKDIFNWMNFWRSNAVIIIKFRYLAVCRDKMVYSLVMNLCKVKDIFCFA